jgi:hypothetical protein
MRRQVRQGESAGSAIRAGARPSLSLDGQRVKDWGRDLSLALSDRRGGASRNKPETPRKRNSYICATPAARRLRGQPQDPERRGNEDGRPSNRRPFRTLRARTDSRAVCWVTRALATLAGTIAAIGRR